MKSFQALFIEKEADNTSLHFRETTIDNLPENEVTIEVHYSGINYKDGLAVLPDGKIVSEYPFIPGIDASGVVVNSKSDQFQVGDEVIVTSYDFGVSYFGGYSEFIRVPAEWVVPLPDGLSLKEAMILGTAGFTAALSVDALEFSGVNTKCRKNRCKWGNRRRRESEFSHTFQTRLLCCSFFWKKRCKGILRKIRCI